MNTSKISIRYAKALFELAKEKNLLEDIRKDLTLLKTFFKVKDFQDFIESPIITPSQKKEIFHTLLGDQVQEITLSFIDLLVENKREAYLELMILDFFKFYREHFGIKEVELTTAIELDEEEKAKFKEFLKKALNSEIELVTKLRKDIIGGFILRIEDKMLDMSVSSRLKQIKKQLIN